MDSLLAIGVGLVLRILLDAVTDNDDRVSGVLVGMWEGVVLNHFIRRIPRSFDPYLGFGFRIFVDFLFTQSLSRLALVALWSLVGMLLADVVPNLWRDSGLRRLYRQVRKDVRRVERAVPRIRIKNDLPSMRLFNRSRTASSSQASSSVRSDRATPSRSPVPSPAPSPARRPGRTPPGTFPNVSGWSETGTDVSTLRVRVEDVVTHPGPSPSLIPSQELAAYGRTDTTHVSMSQTTVQETTATVMITQAQTQKSEFVVRETVVETATTVAAAAASMSVAPIEDASRHNPPTIPDDWVDVDRPPGTRANEPVAPFQPDPESTPESQPPTPSRPTSIAVPPPVVDCIPDIPDVDHGNKGSRPPDQIPLPESRAASVIGGVHDQPQSREGLRDRFRSHLEATSEIGVDPKSLAPIAMQSTKSQTTSRASSRVGSRLKQSVDVDAPQVPPKEPAGEPVILGTTGPVHSTEPIVVPPPAADSIPDVSHSKARETGPVHRINPIVVPPPAVDRIPDLNPGNKESPPPYQIPLPESRAASVIGGVYDQPRALRDAFRSRVDKATSEIGVDPKSLAPIAMQATKSQATSRASSRVGSRLKQSIDVNVPNVPPKEPVGGPVSQGTTGPVHSTAPLMTTTPAQVDPPASILSHSGDADTPPLLLATSPRGPERTQISKVDSTLVDPAPEGSAEVAGRDKGSSLLDLPSPTRTPPPPFSEFAGAPEDPAATKDEPVTQDEGPTELTEEQKAVEEKRLAFLSLQARELEGSRADLQKQLKDEDDPYGSTAKALESDLEDSEKTLSAVATRLKKEKFSKPPSDPSIKDISLTGKLVSEVQSLLTSAVLDMLLAREDAGPMTVQFTINRSKPLKGNAKAMKDAVHAFAKRHKFAVRSENATPGIINITF